MNFRFNTEQTPQGLSAAVEGTLRDAGLDFHCEWTLSGMPFITAESDLVAATRAAVQEVTGRDPVLSTGGGTSDGRFIAPSGAQVVELGPVNASIHRVNEHVRIADLERLSAIYRGILDRVLDSGD